MKHLLSLLAFVSFFAAQANAQTANGSDGPQFTFKNNDRVHDFGGIAFNTTATYDVEFRNTGKKTLVITDMHSVADRPDQPPLKIQIKYPDAPVKPGRKGHISVFVTALHDAGSFKNEILATSNATNDNYPLLVILGSVTPTPHEGKTVTTNEMEGLFMLFTPVVANGK